MRRIRLVSLLALSVALVVAACSGGTASSPSGAAPSASAAPSSAATRIEVKLTDAFRIEPAMMTVPAGRPVTFVVTNSGVIDHEFFVGDETAQMGHEQKMMEGGMAHDEPMGMGLKPGQTKELTITFDAAGPLLAGCHVAGHYVAGMKATIEVEG